MLFTYNLCGAAPERFECGQGFLPEIFAAQPPSARARPKMFNEVNLCGAAPVRFECGQGFYLGPVRRSTRAIRVRPRLLLRIFEAQPPSVRARPKMFDEGNLCGAAPERFRCGQGF